MTLTGPIVFSKLESDDRTPGELIRWDRRVAHIELSEGRQSPPPGTLVEFHCSPILFFGQVQRSTGSQVEVAIEYSLDQRRLEWINKAWRSAPRR